MNEIQTVEYWTEVAMKSGLFPERTNPFQVKAIIEIGRQIGLSPFQALKHIQFIKGKINMEVAAKLALFKKHGGKVGKIDSTKERAYVELIWEGNVYPAEFTIKDAENMGLTNPTTREGKPYRGAYEKYPAKMLMWRAIGNMLDFLIPDLLAGFYSTDELASFMPDVKIENEQDEKADEQILKEMKENEEVAKKLRTLGYTRKDVTKIYKDFNGNMEKISLGLDYEINHMKKPIEPDIPEIDNRPNDEDEPDWVSE